MPNNSVAANTANAFEAGLLWMRRSLSSSACVARTVADASGPGPPPAPRRPEGLPGAPEASHPASGCECGCAGPLLGGPPPPLPPPPASAAPPPPLGARQADGDGIAFRHTVRDTDISIDIQHEAEGTQRCGAGWTPVKHKSPSKGGTEPAALGPLLVSLGGLAALSLTL